MSDLELDRAKSQSRVDEVVPYTQVSQQAKRRLGKEPGLLDVVEDLLKARGVASLEVPLDFSVGHADGLRARGFQVQITPDPFYPERLLKAPEEIAAIRQTLKATEEALESALELLRNSEIRSDGTLWLGGKPLTAELVRKVMHIQLLEQDCIGQHTIIACGIQAVDPHQEGYGPLRAHEPIVIDVFPQHTQSRYFADLTRTVVKGRALPKTRQMFEAVKAAQAMACERIHDGADGSEIHQEILTSFEELGFPTGEQQGRMQGFFHGTGHGVGLEIHEPPRISGRKDILKSGMVVTVEPGLYYLEGGGVRLEDMVVVEREGCEVLTKAPRVLELP